MNILIVMDSFKGTLSAEEACEAVCCGIPDSHSVMCMPMADGGEGTAAAVMRARPETSEWMTMEVNGPLSGQRVATGYLWFAAERVALVEMAAASGLPLITSDQRNPLVTTTFGTGELMRAAADRGAKRIILAVGGSATVDAGVGMAQALGWEITDGSGQAVGPGGGALIDIQRIVPPSTDFPAVEVLCDVENPLLGERGAAPVFGPQKGADPAAVDVLARGLAHVADVWEAQLGQDVRTIPGGGAAGGIAAGAIAFLGATLRPGVEVLLDLAAYDEHLKRADLVITGEGCFDATSLEGKLVSGVARRAALAGVPVGVVAGRVDLAEADWRSAGFRFAVGSKAEEGIPETVDEAIRRLKTLVTREFSVW